MQSLINIALEVLKIFKVVKSSLHILRPNKLDLRKINVKTGHDRVRNFRS